MSRSNKNDIRATAGGRFSDLDADKLRGGYYTPSSVSQWLCQWAINSKSEKVLEPSCGDGGFLVTAAKRLRDLGATKPMVNRQLKGVEILASEASVARTHLEGGGWNGKEIVSGSDFFAWKNRNSEARFDVIIGNPPFIRYQSFPEPHRTLAMKLMSSLGLIPNRLTNIWVPFVAAAVASLSEGGKLALVLPSELLQVSYAAQLRSYLTEHFARIDIVACNEMFFEKAQQEVVLLLAEGARASSQGGGCRVTLTETESLAKLLGQQPENLLRQASPKQVDHSNEKWLKYFLSEAEIHLMRELRDSPAIAQLKNHAEVDVGVVTGKNEFFVLSQEQASEHGLADFTVPLVSRSAHLKGAKIGVGEWKKLAQSSDRVHLLNIRPDAGKRLTASLARYIRSGEDRDIHKGYKCSVRAPWYTVPSVWIPDGFVFRQIHDFPRVVLNEAEATSTDTIHRLTCKGRPERVIANMYTYLTAASAEIEGRSYGGGVLELEPTEAERLLMPATLNGAMPVAESDKLIRAGKLDHVLESNNNAVLREHLGLSKRDCTSLKNVWIKMRDRRISRKRAKHRVVDNGQ